MSFLKKKEKRMKLYNTLTRKVDKFRPIRKRTVALYTCGPTVYDHAHIGHWFTYIRMDLLVRTLEANGYKVIWELNITDVGHLTSDEDTGEDKLEKGAKREGKTAWEVAKYYEKEFINEMQLLNIRKPSYLVRATDHIKEQISLIQTLEKKGYTYKISDGIYYDTSKFKKYANFAKLDLDEQQAGARVEFNPEKRNKTDFALWKFSPIDQKRDMQWDSPWGIGFPGWHIECSAMALNYLGETIDIHAGGIDHIPVHHTNEIAQSEAATGKRLANYWMHSNHISVDGQKISKSLGNSITLKEIEKNNYSPEDLRLLVLESSYMTQSKFSYDALSSAKKRLEDLYAVSVLRYQANKNFKRQKVYLRKFDKDLLLAMSNNLDSPKVMVLLSEFTKKFLDNGINIKDLKEFNKTIKNMDELLGLKNVDLKDISIENKKLIEERVVAKQNNDYKKSDEIRNELLKRRIGLRDKETSNWYYL